MAVRIGLVSSAASSALAEELRPLVPAGSSFEPLSVAEASTLIDEGQLTVLIVAMDGDDIEADLQGLMDLHAIGEHRRMAVLALVPRADPMALVRAFDLHVADVAGLPVDPHEVRARLGALVRRRLVALARAAETRAVRRLALIDPVTGLHNRHHLDSVLPAAIDNARLQSNPLALLMVDMDALKPYNDCYGHAAGDQALRRVADVLKGHVRLCDTVARYGGDEIAIVMPDADRTLANALATRLVAAVAEKAQPHDGVPPVPVTVSIGLAMLDPRTDDAQALIVKADAALYSAKRSGRNRSAQAA